MYLLIMVLNGKTLTESKLNNIQCKIIRSQRLRTDKVGIHRCCPQAKQTKQNDKFATKK